MKIKSFLYNQSTEETVDLAYSTVKSIAKQLGISLKSEKDFRKRMGYGIERAKSSRWANKGQEIGSIKVAVVVGYSSPWTTSTRENMEYSIVHELTDPDVTDIGLCSVLSNYANSIKIIVEINYYQAWRRQAKQKIRAKTVDLKEILSGSAVKK